MMRHLRDGIKRMAHRVRVHASRKYQPSLVKIFMTRTRERDLVDAKDAVLEEKAQT